MALKDTIAMEVPLEPLKYLTKHYETGAKQNSIDEMATNLASSQNDIAKKLVDNYQFAGNYPFNLNIIKSGLDSQWECLDNFERHLIKKYSEKIFTSGIQPKLETHPKVIKVFKRESKLILAFAYLGQPRRIYRYTKIETVQQQYVNYVIIHFNPFSIEVRAKQDKNDHYLDAILDILDITDKDSISFDNATKLSEKEVIELASRLKSGLKTAKHKMNVGVYDTKEVTANTTIDDLAATEEYKNEFGNQPMTSKTFRFEYRYALGYTETVSYTVTKKGIKMNTKSGEEVFKYILDNIIEIKYPTDVTNQTGVATTE